MRRRADIVIIAAVVIVIIAAAAALYVFHGDDTARVDIYVGSGLYESVDKHKTVVVEQDGGRVNVIEITAEGVRMKSSTCPNQDCVRQGLVGYDDGGLLSEWIICLPNGVSVEIIG